MAWSWYGIKQPCGLYQYPTFPLIWHETKCLELLLHLLTNSKLIFVIKSHIHLAVNICWTKKCWFVLEADHLLQWYCSVPNYSGETHSVNSRQLPHSSNYNCVTRPAATRHTLKPFEAAIWAAVQPLLLAWLMRSAGTTGLDVPSRLSSPPSKSKMPDSGSSCNEFPRAGALWYMRSLRLSTLPVSTAAWTGVQPSWK